MMFGAETPTRPGGDLYPVTGKFNAERLEYVFKVGHVEPINADRWAVFLGDFLFNLRSALDQLVYQLHVLRYDGQTVPEKVEADSAFPIHVKWVHPNDISRRREIVNLKDHHRALIEKLQPYHAPKLDGYEFIRRSLGQLHTLNVIDKHRRLHVVRTVQKSFKVVAYPDEYGFVQHPVFSAVESDAMVERWTFAKLPPEVDVHHEVALRECIDDGSGVFLDVRSGMQSIFNDVLDLFRLFAADFPPVQLPSSVGPLGAALF
jgi:hypothetical protein